MTWRLKYSYIGLKRLWYNLRVYLDHLKEPLKGSGNNTKVLLSLGSNVTSTNSEGLSRSLEEIQTEGMVKISMTNVCFIYFINHLLMECNSDKKCILV